MNQNVVIQLPTLCTPEKLNRTELIAQVNYLQAQVMDMAANTQDALDSASEFAAHIKNMAVMFNTLADSYEAGDQAAILLQVKKIAERRTGTQTPARSH